MERGYRVVLACRNTDAAQSAAAQMNRSTASQAPAPQPSSRRREQSGASPHASARAACEGMAEAGPQLDLTSLDSVRSFAAGFQKQHRRLDVLVNNAGCNVKGAWYVAGGVPGMVMVRALI